MPLKRSFFNGGSGAIPSRRGPQDRLPGDRRNFNRHLVINRSNLKSCPRRRCVAAGRYGPSRVGPPQMEEASSRKTLLEQFHVGIGIGLGVVEEPRRFGRKGVPPGLTGYGSRQAKTVAGLTAVKA